MRLSDPLVVPLIMGLTREYDLRYGENDEMATVDAQVFDPPSGTFVVLVDGGEVLAGGGLRRITDDACEVKRMWTAEERRRKGYATRVLTGLEDAARAAGYSTLLLETGPPPTRGHRLLHRPRLPPNPPLRPLPRRPRLPVRPGLRPLDAASDIADTRPIPCLGTGEEFARGTDRGPSQPAVWSPRRASPACRSGRPHRRVSSGSQTSRSWSARAVKLPRRTWYASAHR